MPESKGFSDLPEALGKLLSLYYIEALIETLGSTEVLEILRTQAVPVIKCTNRSRFDEHCKNCRQGEYKTCCRCGTLLDYARR